MVRKKKTNSTTLKTRRKREKRLDNLKPFSPGNPGGPGRPPKENTFSDTARALMAAKDIDVTWTTNGKQHAIKVTSDKNIYYGVVSALILEAMEGNIPAIKELIDRTQGKPQQGLDMKAEITGGVWDKMASKDRLAFIREAVQAIKG